LTEERWDYYFPLTSDKRCTGKNYTYEGFLKAVARYPALCGENNTDLSDLSMCKKEIASIFAHVVRETNMNSEWDVYEAGLDWWR